MKEIPGNVYNELREKLKKSDALNYVKELCAKYKEDIEDFTSTAMMAAYQKYRLKALDYMLSLEGQHEASLLVKIQTQKMMFEKDSFESEKEMKVLLLICKHFDSTLILNELDNCKNSRMNSNDVIQRHKELSYVVLNSKIPVSNKTEKKLKI